MSALISAHILVLTATHPSFEADFIVVAAGHQPNLDLFMDKLALNKDVNGLAVDDQ